MAFGGRFYKHNGRKLPSVTTICGALDKPALVYWSAGCTADYILDELDNRSHQWILDEPSPKKITEELRSIIEASRKNWRKVSARAMDIGSAVHACIEAYLDTGHEPQAPEDAVLSGFLAFLEWESQHSLKPIQTEHTVYGDLYAGTTDLIAKLDGKLFVVDFKTFNSASRTQPPYPEAKYQIAAYRACVPGAEGCGILYLGKSDGIMKWFDTSASYETDLAIFNHLVEVYYLTHKELRRE